MRLNPRNEIVARIYGFIGSNVERVRLDLERQDRERRNAAEAKKLEKEANAIAEIINKDFAEWKTLAKFDSTVDSLQRRTRESSSSFFSRASY